MRFRVRLRVPTVHRGSRRTKTGVPWKLRVFPYRSTFPLWFPGRVWLSKWLSVDFWRPKK